MGESYESLPSTQVVTLLSTMSDSRMRKKLMKQCTEQVSVTWTSRVSPSHTAASNKKDPIQSLAPPVDPPLVFGPYYNVDPCISG